MKLKRSAPLALLMCLALTACQAQELDRAALGWEENWTAVGDVVAAEPLEGFEPGQNLDVMSAAGLWYATWTAGEMEVRENSEGQRAEIYDAQLYMVIQEFKSESKVAPEMETWKKLERDQYSCGETRTREYGGVSYEIVPLLTAAEDNPYSHGAAAFGTHGKFGVCLELLCREEYQGDAETLLEDFLAGLHYHFDDGEAE